MNKDIVNEVIKDTNSGPKLKCVVNLYKHKDIIIKLIIFNLTEPLQIRFLNVIALSLMNFLILYFMK